MSQRFWLDKEDLIKIVKVLGWSVASAGVTAVISILASAEIPTQYLFLVPIANTILFSLQRFIADNSK